MDELRDASIHHTALKVFGELKNMQLYENLYETVQRLVCAPNIDKNNMKTTLELAIKTNGLETEIRDIVYHQIRTSVKSELRSTITANDPLNYLRRAGVQWERRVRKSLNAMCLEMKVTLQGQPRPHSDREELGQKWEELSNVQTDLGNYRPVYAPKDLLEVLLALKGPLRHDDELYPRWEFAHIAIPVKNMFELRVHFLDLIRNDGNKTDNWLEQCQKVVHSKHSPLCQHVLKKGNTPAPFRGALWSSVLGSQLKSFNIEHWERLKSSVLQTDLIVDKLIFKDIQLTATNDDQYFVFEDVLYQVMLCFSRDTEINRTLHPMPETGSTTSGAQPAPAATTLDQLASAASSKTSTSTAASAGAAAAAAANRQYDGPPSGIVPFHGICMFAAPFCYIYESPVQLYFTFRAFYIRYCHRLTTINTHPQGIVCLCLLFEKLLQTHEPQLWSHLRELKIQPIRVVFKWLMRAFSGHLPPEELLILWDLILGFDSLEIIPLLAIIILSFRRDSLMQVDSMESIEAVLADLSSIKVLPLIQLALSRD